jgi:hypothetical protein
VSAFGFGAASPGHTYPTIWAAGWYNNGTGFTYGIWVCKDWDGEQTWQRASDGYPNGWPLPILDLDGDKGIPQQVYGVTGSGAFYIRMNFLLKRDLLPSTNDNTPVGVTRIA